MNIRQYIMNIPVAERDAERERLAKMLSISIHTLRAYCKDESTAGSRKAPVDTVIKLQRLTDGRIRLIDEYPDIEQAVLESSRGHAA